jgi:putative transposase
MSGDAGLLLGNAPLLPNLRFFTIISCCSGNGMRYRRAKTPGATYFFTVVTYRRRRFLCDPENVALLRAGFRFVKQRHPFDLDAFVLLPDHLHCIWTLPPDDRDYPLRWNLIKTHFTRHCAAPLKSPPSEVRHRKREQAVWQRRYWEHQIRDDRDFECHVDYIHWNPVKHGLATRPTDWPYSSIHRYLRQDLLPADWAEGVAEDLGAYGE